MSQRKLVILDKNFLQKENEKTPRLRALALCGCDFVLTDTLIYEICSDKGSKNQAESKRKDPSELWRSIQQKLSRFADRLHAWFHVSDLLKREICHKKPIDGPEDIKSTERLQDLVQSGQTYVPPDLNDIVNQETKLREKCIPTNILKFAREIGKVMANDHTNKQIISSKDILGKTLRENLNNEKLMQWAIVSQFGNRDKHELYIPDAGNRIDKKWFLYHYTRSLLALAALYLSKYGLNEQPNQNKLANTYQDVSCLLFLNYADGLASDERRDMFTIFEWLYGSSKKYITTEKLFELKPAEDNIHTNAYIRWEARGKTHGHNLHDWFEAEKELFAHIWDQL